MKNLKSKRILALLICIVMLFSATAFSASAANDEEVAKMWLCSEINKNTGIGHIFLYFENLTDEPIKVGRYTVPGYDIVSVGCFGTEGPRGAGVYYNLESDLKHYHSLKGVSTELTQEELSNVTNKIKNYNTWNPIANCYYFAALGWNAGADKDVPFLIFPSFARLFIQMNGGVSEPFDLFYRDMPVYRQTEL